VSVITCIPPTASKKLVTAMIAKRFGWPGSRPVLRKERPRPDARGFPRIHLTIVALMSMLHDVCYFGLASLPAISSGTARDPFDPFSAVT
jgi:hypothetical protein